MVTSNIPYMYDFITKFCKQQAKVILSYDNESAALDEAKSSAKNVRDTLIYMYMWCRRYRRQSTYCVLHVYFSL